MKTLTLLFALAMMCLKAHSQTISADSAKYYEHKKVTVCGTAYLHATTNVTFINFGQPYPKSPFTAVIFAAEKPRFAAKTGWSTNNVCVTGTVDVYKNKPQIILRDTSQLQLK